MRTFFIMSTAIAVICFALAVSAQSGDKEHIEALIHEYNSLDESGDLAAQSRMMTKDRIYILTGVRYTSQANQTANMRAQMAVAARPGAQNGGGQSIITAVDPIIRVYGNAAVASFIRHTNFVPAEGPIPPVGRQFITLVLVKQGGSWKIDLTQYTPVVAPSAN